MAKRIVSGIFILTALGALGVILAGAMTSGEQLIVRFLTAVTVAALALYVISDLRLQSEQDGPPQERPKPATETSRAQSATAVMATVTGPHRTGIAPRHYGIDPQSTPIFEAFEPVTASSRISVGDPTEAVTGSRLVPPLPVSEDRAVHPHPETGAPAKQSLSSRMPSAASQPTAPPLPVGNTAVRSESLGLVDDETGEPSAGSVIATTAFTYSGRLATGEVEWPPKAPEPIDRFPSGPNDDESSERVAIDAPTAELPALRHPTVFNGSSASLLAELGLDGDDGRRGDDIETATRTTADIDLGEAETGEAETAEDEAETAEPEPAQAETAEDGTAEPQPATLHLRIGKGAADESPAAEPSSPVRQIEASQYASPNRAELVDLRDAAEPFAPIPSGTSVAASPFTGTDQAEKLSSAIRSGELQVVNSLINQGMLSTDGPITDRDVRTMVYVAFTSNELRKLILAGGTPDGIRAGDLDLGEVELFDESRFAPPPKRLYSGVPTKPEHPQETVLDLVALEESAARTSSDSPTEDLSDLDDSDLVRMLPTPSHLYRRAAEQSRVER